MDALHHLAGSSSFAHHTIPIGPHLGIIRLTGQEPGHTEAGPGRVIFVQQFQPVGRVLEQAAVTKPGIDLGWHDDRAGRHPGGGHNSIVGRVRQVKGQKGCFWRFFRYGVI